MSAAAEVIPTAVMEAAANAAPAAAATAVETAATTAQTAASAAETAATPLLETATEAAGDAAAHATDAVADTATAISGPAADLIPEPSVPITDAGSLENRVAEVRDVVAAKEAGSGNAGSTEAPIAEAASGQPDAAATNETVAPPAGEKSTDAASSQDNAEGNSNAAPKPETAESAEQKTAESQAYIPKALRDDPEFQRQLGEAVANANNEGNVDLNAVTKKALDEHYAAWAKEQSNKPLPEEILNNAVYKALLQREIASLPDGAERTIATLKALAEWKYIDDILKDAAAEKEVEKRKSLITIAIEVVLSIVLGGIREGAVDSGVLLKK